MTLAEFLKIKSCTDEEKAALLVYWKKPGKHDVPTPKFWKRIERIQREILKREPFFKAFLDAPVSFTVEKFPRDGSIRAFMAFGPYRLWNSISRADFTLETLNGEQVANGGFKEAICPALKGADPKAVPAPAKNKRGRKAKAAAAKPLAKETRTPKEIQDATPYELRTGWTNYDLLDATNERVFKESCEYWDKHGGEVAPRRRKRRNLKK